MHLPMLKYIYLKVESLSQSLPHVRLDHILIQFSNILNHTPDAYIYSSKHIYVTISCHNKILSVPVC